MFTGLVQAVGRVEAINPTPAGAQLIIDPRQWAHAPAHGDSIAVSGCCLTVAQPPHTPRAPNRPASDRLLHFDAVAETLRRTTLGSLRPGSPVNLEHAVRADTLMGGHFVQGHIEGVGRVTRINRDPADWRVTIESPADLMDAVIPKGSIAVEGVSLTVAAVDHNSFTIALIPTTLALTTLASLNEDDAVNLETDMLARAVAHILARRDH